MCTPAGTGSMLARSSQCWGIALELSLADDTVVPAQVALCHSPTGSPFHSKESLEFLLWPTSVARLSLHKVCIPHMGSSAWRVVDAW